MSGFERLGRELELASERERGRRRRRAPSWSRRAGSAGGAAAIAAALATVAVVVVGAVALLHGHNGRPGSTAATGAGATAPPAPAGQAAAWTRLLTCSRGGRDKQTAPIPVTTDAAPDPRLVAALGVLRGPWTAADAAPALARNGICRDTVLPLPEQQTIDVRYVRYIGPGLDGGKVFLAPGKLVVPSLLPAGVKRKLGLPRSFPEACLITVGSAPISEACTPLQLIEHPVSALPALPGGPAPIPLHVARRVCSHVRSRVKCIANLRHLRFGAPPHLVLSAVVRDEIASIDVYLPAVRGKQRLLATIPVRNNVYTFAPARPVVGPLKFIFRDAGGQVVPATPVHTGTGKVIATVGP